MAEGFKFIHASDLHLDQPMQGLTELPASLKPALVEAPCLAAKGIFDLAVNERVDFVMLSGGLFDHRRASPRSRAFLLNQFERLAERKIRIYWSAAEAADWPAQSELPSNVNRFSSRSIEVVRHVKNGQVLATLYGACSECGESGFANFSANPGDPFPIALSAGEIPLGEVGHSNFRYWALGGRSMTDRLETEQGVVAFPGTPQGRSIQETGPRGCLLGQVNASGVLQLEPVETSAVNWLQQKITVSEAVTDDQLKNIFMDRAITIASESSDRNTLVQWHVLTTGAINRSLRQVERRKQLVEWLRAEFGSGQEPWLWTTELRVDPPDSLPKAWYSEDTILGEYLRAIETCQDSNSPTLLFDDYLPGCMADGTDSWVDLASLDAEHRAMAFRQSVMLGVDCMGPLNSPPSRHEERGESPAMDRRKENPRQELMS